MAKRLDSAVAVRNVKTPGRHPAGETLYLMVWPSARKSWVQRLTIEGKRKDLGLGPYPTVSLAQARERAHDNLSQVKSGGNPLAAKQEEARLSAIPTFEDLASQHIAENLGSWRNAKHRAQWSSTLAAYAFPTLGALKVNEITRRHVVDALAPIWTSKPVTARRVRQRIRAVMDRAAALEFIDYNPAGDVINAALAKQPRVKNHHRALPYERLPAALCAVRASAANASVKLAFEMLALTACRSGEVRGMTWDEVDLREATWTVPEARMKAGRLHRVPLSHRALAILEEARSRSDGDGVVFPSPHTGTVLSPHGVRPAAEAAGVRLRSAWSALQLQGLGGGADRCAPRRGGERSSARGGQRHRGGLLPLRPLRPSPQADGGMEQIPERRHRLMSSLLEQLRSAVKQRVSMLSEELPDDIPAGMIFDLGFFGHICGLLDELEQGRIGMPEWERRTRDIERWMNNDPMVRAFEEDATKAERVPHASRTFLALVKRHVRREGPT